VSEIENNEQAMQWCRERNISINFVEVPGKVRLYVRDDLLNSQNDLLMEGNTLQEAVEKTVRYSRAMLPNVEEGS
jgi:hypothetical protein